MATSMDTGKGPSWGWRARAIEFTLLGIILGLAYQLIEQGLEYTAQNNYQGVYENKIRYVALACINISAVLFWMTVTPARRMVAAVFATAAAAGFMALFFLAEQTYGWEFASGDAWQAWLYAATIIIIVTIPFFRTVVERGRPLFDYETLFETSWTSVIVFVAACVFGGAVWMLLQTLAKLFEFAAVDFQAFIDRFSWPIFLVMFATGVAILRGQEEFTLKARHAFFMLFRVLLPLISIATIVFIALLLVNGPKAEEINQTADITLIGLILIALLLINAEVGGSVRDRMEGQLAWLGRLAARVQCVLMPFMVGVALYAIWLRAEAQGLGNWDVYKGVMLGALALYAVVYAVTAVLPQWAAIIRRTNPPLALLTVALAVLTILPVINAERLAADHNYARLKDGKVSAVNFDYGKLYFDLGRAGRDVIERIRKDESLPDRGIIELEVASLYSAESYWAWQTERQKRREEKAKKPPETVREILARLVTIHPKGAVLPRSLIAALETDALGIRDCGSWEDARTACYLMEANITDDGLTDYATFVLVERDRNRDRGMPIDYGMMLIWLYLQNEDGSFSAYGGYNTELLPRPSDAWTRTVRDLENGTVTFEPWPMRFPVVGGVHHPIHPSDKWLRERGAN